tara:strand:- start:548 stop:1051 length:504 start_codon:yes stop_codon:yes gene_type:complete
MAVNKNFVVKNGLEVNDNLLIADVNSQKVGIGTSVASHTLHVLGGIGVTEALVTGIATFLSDVNISGNLNVSGTSTLNNLVVTGVTTVGVVTGASAAYFGDGSGLTGLAPGLTAAIGIQSGGIVIGSGITSINLVGTGLTSDVDGNQGNFYLPPPGVSLGLAIALGG